MIEKAKIEKAKIRAWVDNYCVAIKDLQNILQKSLEAAQEYREQENVNVEQLKENVEQQRSDIQQSMHSFVSMMQL